MEDIASQLGDFSGTFFFCMKPSSIECEKFLYKHHGLPAPMPGGVILYRNAFSISAYDGKKDWLGFGKRSRKSPAAASHPTGAWRVRENQISGKIEIDKRRNAMLQDLSNRQGLDENIYYQLFVDIILLGFKEFERYRQDIVRHINVKNESISIPAKTPVSDKVVQNPKLVPTLTVKESMQLADEIKSYRQESQDARQERTNVEERYKYDIRILNVLATTGLKASSIAHEMRNDRNSISANTDYIIAALQEYGMWDELLSPEKTKKTYKNVPVLLEKGREKCAKIVSFMDTMLSEIEKRQFHPGMQSIMVLLNRIKESWERDYAWISICIRVASDIEYYLSEDVLHVIFDNLILNSIQQNEKSNHLNIIIQGSLEDGLLKFSYSDNGVGLAQKYQNNPMKILEVHETTRKNGHGLGMWIVNNRKYVWWSNFGYSRYKRIFCRVFDWRFIVMEEYNLLYIDDDIDSQLSEYLDKDLKNALQSDVVLNISEHEFKPAEGYKSLLENPQVATANIILIDSRLFENNSATDGKFSGEEFKIILKKQFPFIEVVVITQNGEDDSVKTIAKFNPKCGLAAKEYYDHILPDIIKHAIEQVKIYRNLAIRFKSNDSWEPIIKERVLGSLNGTAAYDSLTAADIDKLVLAFQEMSKIINE
mgnify:CR=1 FL=1